MGFITGLILSSMLGTLTDGSLSADDLHRIIDVMHMPIRNLYCEYEGTTVFPQAIGNSNGKAAVNPTDENGLFDNYSGTFLEQNCDAFIVDIFHRYTADKGLNRQTLASIAGKTEIFGRTDASLGGGTVRHSTAADADIEGSYGRLFLAGFLRGLLEYSKKRMVNEHDDVVNGRICKVFAFYLGQEPYDPGPSTLVYRFWVDIERGANVVKKEEFRGKKILLRNNIVLSSVKAPNSQMVWIPESGTIEAFDNEGAVVHIEELRIMMASVRINQNINDKQFSIKYPVGAVITDRLRKEKYEFGQDRRPPAVSVAEAEIRLDEALTKAAESRSELIANSWSRSQNRSNFFYAAMLSIAVIVFVVSAIAFFRRRQS